MAKLSPEAFGEKMKLAREAKKAAMAVETTTETPKETEIVKDNSLSVILKRLEALETENAKIKGNDPVSIARSKKEHYK